MLLLDQNISFRVLKYIHHVFDAEHVCFLGMESSTDTEIWEYAKSNKRVVITQDSDFYDRSILLGQPPKVLWIRSGNVSTKNMVALLLNNVTLIKAFLNNNNHSCLTIY